MIRWFAKNHVAANVLMLAILLLGGYLAYFKLGVEVEPAKKYPTVNIHMRLPGASPEEVEKKIVLPIEEALSNISGVRELESEVYTGSAHIKARAKSNTDLNKLKADVESRMDRISTLPTQRETPNIYIPDSAWWKEVISVAIYGDLSDEDLLKAARKVKADLEATKEISKVDIVGQKKREISIELKPEKLNAFKLSFADVRTAIRRSSFDLSAGTVKTNGERISIRSDNKAYYGAEFEKLVIVNRNGSVIRLGDITTITDSFESKDQKEIKFNGKPAIFVEVKRFGEGNALAIANKVHDYINNAKDSFPPGVNLAPWDDDSVSLKGRITTLVSNLIQGALLVMIMLGLFLRPRIAFWVTLGIPVSFAGALIYMYFFDVTINNMSLFGFIIVLGLVVDDAIVTGENVFTHIKSGKYSGLDAAVIGTKEVATSVTFGVVTTMVAFTSMFFLDGNFGEQAKQIPLVVIPVLFFSLIESKLILPAHLKHIKGERKKDDIFTKAQSAVSHSMEWLVQKAYRPALKFAISYRFAIIVAFGCIFWVGYQFKQTRMDYQFMPSSERYFIFARLKMHEGTSVERTKSEINRIAAAAVDMRKDFMDGDQSLIGDVVTSSGGWLSSWSGFEPEKGFVFLEIIPPSMRSEPGPKNAEIAAAWRARVGEIEFARSFTIRTETNQSKNNRDRDNNISIELRGNDEDEKAAVAVKMKQWLSEQEGLQRAYGNAPYLKRELQIKMKPLAKENGRLSEDSLAEQVRTAFHGTRIDKLQRGEDEINVMLRLPESTRTSLHTLSTLRVSLNNTARGSGSDSNKEVSTTAPITQYADIIETKVPPSIKRINRSRVIYTGADAKDKNRAIELEPAIHDKMMELCQQHSSVSWRFTGVLENYREESRQFYTVIIGLLFGLFALLAIPFKSFIQPLYVLCAVPFGMVGAYAGHYILDITPSLLSLLGILALLGVVVNDSLVLVDYMNKRREEGVPLLQAVQEAGARRFRPIMLTSITTFVGLLPIMSESSIQAQYLIPMAVSLGYGILFATLITLVLIPCIYYVGESTKEFLSNSLKFKKTKEG